MEKKLAMLAAAEHPGVTVKELCAQLGVSRDTFYEWRRRFEAEGHAGLMERSRRPHRSPGATPVDVEDAIVLLRKELPVENGADVIGFHLRRMGYRHVPSDRTIHRVLVRRGLVVPHPQRRPKSSFRRFEFDRPNECWQIDATGWQLAGGVTATLMNIVDDHSRVATAARVGERGATTRLALDTVLAGAHTWGPPAMVLSDNGPCFAARHADWGASEFETTLAALGVRVIHSRPYHPQTCGKVERFHQTMKRWLAAQPLARTHAALQAQLDGFLDRYNHDRPHKAIGNRPPAERHAAGVLAGPGGDPITLEDPARLTISASRVRANGTIALGHWWRVQIGSEHVGHHVTVVRYGNVAVILDGTTLLRRVQLNPDRRYIGNGRPRGGARKPPH